MPYIYKITNDTNQKLYIGKTIGTLEKRWQEHCHDAYIPSKEHRPLYAAMRKYGIEHFHMELIEECDYTVLNEREQYWIAYFNSYHYGYNATLGGDGRVILDYTLVYETYLQCNENCSRTATLLGVDAGHVATIIKAMGGQTHPRHEYSGTMVNMYDLQGNYIRTFSSTREAARFLVESQNKDIQSLGGYSSHIVEVCKGKRKTCQGYIWRYASA